MPIIVMQVLDAQPHPNAEMLRVYQFGNAGADAIQVVANTSNVYSVGDRVAVACVGSELPDGTKIRPARLRGVDSFGMALGAHPGELGADVSTEFGAATVPMKDMPMKDVAKKDAQLVSWPSIELLHHIRSHVLTTAELQQTPAPRVRYRCKVKLDGTNAGVQIHPDGSVLAQSRSQVLVGDLDNMGFAAWVKQNAGYFRALKSDEPLIIFGEWCGSGIQKRAAISHIDRKIFVVFAVQLGLGATAPARLEVEPDLIRARFSHHPDVFVLPWLAEEFELDFADPTQLQAAAESISGLVERVEQSDPWVEQTFQISGVGEGVVLYPRLNGSTALDRTQLSDLMFKAKGEKHQTVRQKKAAQIEPEVAASIDDFVTLVLAEARLEQAIAEACGGKPEPEAMGAFMKWLVRDVQKECAAELAGAGLTWNQVNKSISNRARSWFIARLNGSAA